MTKKYREKMMAKEPEYLKMISDIEYDILFMLQLRTNNGVVVGEFGNPILSNGKYIYFPKEDVMSKNVMSFDPCLNINVATDLFMYHVKLLSIENGYDCQSINFSPVNFMTGLGTAICHFTNGNIIESSQFMNDPIKLVDLMFKLESDIDTHSQILHDIDEYITFLREERINQKYGERK